MSIRRKIAIAAVLVLVFSLAAYGTLAYLVGSPGTAHNIITSGNVDIDLLDTYPTNVKVMPAVTYAESVTVRHGADSAPCWVRLRPVQTLENAAGEVQEPDTYAGKIRLEFNLASGGWVDGGDGWYYYDAILQGGASTANLLESIAFDGPGIGNEYQNGKYTITFEAQAVQSDNNAPAGGVLDVAGWPAN